MIVLEHLRKEYPRTVPLKDVSVTVNDGDVISVIGPSGTGKSTLIRCINRLETPTSGRILFNGTDITAPDCDISRIRRRMGMVFQSFNLFGHLTAVENVMFAPRKLLGMGKQEAYDRAMELLRSVGMDSRALQYPEMLSGGQKQRVAIAGILAMEPSCIIADEATAMLDPSGRAEVLGTVRALNREKGITVVWITHFMEEAAQADRVVVVNNGAIAAHGTPRELFSQVDKMRELHLDVPHMTDLAESLRRDGIPLPSGVLTVEEMAEEVAKLL